MYIKETQFWISIKKNYLPPNRAVAVDAESHTCLSAQYVYRNKEISKIRRLFSLTKNLMRTEKYQP